MFLIKQRTIEQHVPEGRAVVLGVGRGGCHHAHVVMQRAWQDDVAEGGRHTHTSQMHG